MKPHTGRICEPEMCDYCMYIGEGDFLCSKAGRDGNEVFVMADWMPTDDYLWCKKRGQQKKETKNHA